MTCTLFAKTGKFTFFENLFEYSSGVKSECHKAKYIIPISTLQAFLSPIMHKKDFWKIVKLL